MKPKPFESLNHFTVPVAISVTSGETERVYMQTNVERLRKGLPRTTGERNCRKTTNLCCTDRKSTEYPTKKQGFFCGKATVPTATAPLPVHPPFHHIHLRVCLPIGHIPPGAGETGALHSGVYRNPVPPPVRWGCVVSLSLELCVPAEWRACTVFGRVAARRESRNGSGVRSNASGNSDGKMGVLGRVRTGL